MCGIAGVYGHPDRDAMVRKMVRVLGHRGPDEEMVYSSSRIPLSLGSCRLSIIDRSGGRQPMSNDDGTIWIVHNGEIYNYEFLRSRLQKHFRFRTRSDTEVLLRMYELYGSGMLHDLQGMFAFAILDEREGTLFLARDRLGEKPLLYSTTHAGLSFASELKALEGITHTVNVEALEHYLAYLYIPAPMSIVREVSKLPPAHWAVWRDNSLHVERYWKPLPNPPSSAGEVRQLIEESVRMRMLSDVPVASFISGGIDSTIVTSIAAAHSAALKTISVGFEEKAYDELPYARLVTRRLGTQHEEIVVRPDAATLVPRLAASFDEPFGDSSALPTYVLCREASRITRVALSGDGGDECFGGYRRHALMRWVGAAKRLPRVVTSLLATALPHGSRKWARLNNWISNPEAPAGETYRMLMTYLPQTSDSVRQFITKPFSEFPGDFVSAAGYTDLLTYLPGDLLLKMDTASMAHSLEVRAPFLDHRIVECALAIPGNQKVRGTTTKVFLRHLFRNLLPPQIARRKKQGFAIPLARWLKQDLRPLITDALLNSHPRYESYLEPAMVRRIFTEQDAGQADHAEALWGILMLELWLYRFSVPSTAKHAPN